MDSADDYRRDEYFFKAPLAIVGKPLTISP
jgi:hypothetical protein